MRLPLFDVPAMVQLVAFGFYTMQYIAILLDKEGGLLLSGLGALVSSSRDIPLSGLMDNTNHKVCKALPLFRLPISL